MSTFELRRLGEEDVGWAGSLAAAAGFRSYRPGRLTKALEDGEAFAALRAGRGLGFAVFGGVRPEVELHLLVVARPDRRCGVGRALLEHAHDALVARGHERVFLEVGETNRAARALYRSLGYVAVGRRPAYYPNGDAALILSRDLPRTPVVDPNS
ncbi:MAG: GNAT family N-acetyltransferase [Myxococcota bacterium]